MPRSITDWKNITGAPTKDRGRRRYGREGSVLPDSRGGAAAADPGSSPGGLVSDISHFRFEVVLVRSNDLLRRDVRAREHRHQSERAVHLVEKLFPWRGTLGSQKRKYLNQSVHVSATPVTDDLHKLRALYAAISAYEIETDLAIAEVVRRRQHKGWPRVVRGQMLGFGVVERIPIRTIRVKYLQAFPRRPAVQQQQQQRVPELLNPHWND